MKEQKEILEMEVNSPEEVKKQKEGVNYGCFAMMILSSGIFTILKITGIIEWTWMMVATPVLVLLFMMFVVMCLYFIYNKNNK